MDHRHAKELVLLAGLAALLAGCFSPNDPLDLGTSTSMSSSSGPTGDVSGESGMTTGGTGAGSSSDGTTAVGEVTTGTTSAGADTELGDSSSTGSPVGCGDGVLEPTEACDDGNLDNGDGCSDSCEVTFFGGDTTPCSAQQSEVCEFLSGQCFRTQSEVAGGALCYWEEFSDSVQSCDETPGTWTPDDDPLARRDGIVIPMPGACLNYVGNLQCAPMDQSTCDAAGAAVCFQDKDVDGVGNLGPSLCAWDTSQALCSNTSGIWTSAGSTFELNHPNSVPPGEDGACITQVTNLEM